MYLCKNGLLPSLPETVQIETPVIEPVKTTRLLPRLSQNQIDARSIRNGGSRISIACDRNAPIREAMLALYQIAARRSLSPRLSLFFLAFYALIYDSAASRDKLITALQWSYSIISESADIGSEIALSQAVLVIRQFA